MPSVIATASKLRNDISEVTPFIITITVPQYLVVNQCVFFFQQRF